MSACSSSPARAPLLAVTVPPEWAWAVALRACPVLNLSAAPAGAAPGGYVAVVAGGEHERALVEWMATWCAMGVPPATELPTCAAVAVGRLEAVSHAPDVPRPSHWYVGPVGLWLADVVALPEPVPCAPPLAATYWELPEEVLAQVREGYASVQQAWAARWREYDARKAAALARQTPPPGLRERVLRLCSCRRAMTPCPSCRAFRCASPACPPHACTQEARP